MGRFVAVIATCPNLVLLPGAPVASAEPDIQPVGSVPVPEGPAPAWIVADMDTGQVLAGRDMDVAHPPASTIKTLLALTALDELPNLDATVVSTEADTQVECNCVGIKPGGTYTARNLLDAVLLVSGNDAANALADMIGGYDTAVAKMNAKAASIGAVNTHASTPSGLDGPGGSGFTTPRDLAIHLPRRDGQSGRSPDHFAARWPWTVGGESKRAAGPRGRVDHRDPGAIGGKTGFTERGEEDIVAAG